MARISLAAAIVFVLIAAFFSFQTKSKISGIKEELAAVKANATATANAVAAAQEATKAVEAELATVKTAKEAAESAVATAKAETAKVREEVTAAQSAAGEKDKEIESLKTQLAATPEKQDNSEELNQLQAKVTELQAKVDEQTELAKSFETRHKDAEARVAELNAEKTRRAQGAAVPGLEGKILSVDPGWNFVVLSIGDRQGVARNSTLLVKRGRSLVGRLKVTSVNPSTSIADIVPGSTPQGASIRPGDTVIFGGKM